MSRLNVPSQPQQSEGCAGSRQQALEIAYEMAYGLSHELNNPLANIAGRARLLAEQETDPEKRHQLATIVDQAMRGCEMIADLMLFARPPSWNPRDVDVCTLLSELATRAGRGSSQQHLKIELTVDEQLSSALVQADPSALSEAIWAVLRNAIEVARKHVVIALSRDAEGVLLTIVDDGPGLSEKALSLAFHPYFSGREAGRGIGLGLSKAQRIVALCGGNIALENVAPTGCRVIVHLPSSSSPSALGTVDLDC